MKYKTDGQFTEGEVRNLILATPEDYAARMLKQMREKTAASCSLLMWQNQATLHWWVALESFECDETGNRKLHHSRSQLFQHRSEAQACFDALTELLKP